MRGQFAVGRQGSQPWTTTQHARNRSGFSSPIGRATNAQQSRWAGADRIAGRLLVALPLAVGVVPAMAPAALGAVLRIGPLAAEDPVAVRAAVLPCDDHLLHDDATTLFDD